jgi:asparagine synthase (glutamine-hydrolysing)
VSSLVALVDWTGSTTTQLDVESLLRTAPHRHPDGLWKASAGVASLGFGLRATTRRQRACASPIWHVSDEDLLVVCDARIDNLDQLSKELADLEIASVSDAAVVAKAYRRWGVDAAAKLDGDFAFIVWDCRRRRLYAARDRFGLRSLHYRTTGRRFVVATEVGQILAETETPRHIDPDSVLHHLLWEYGQHRRTFFSAIRRIEPGHFLLATPEATKQVRYWVPPSSPHSGGTIHDYAREFEAIFRNAVAERLESSTPVTVHLSGGLDSSSIVCVASELSRINHPAVPPLTALTATFPGLDCDESSFVETVRAAAGIPLLTWNGVGNDGGEATLVSDVAAPFGQIVGLGGGPPTDLVLSARLGARVLLSGEGGNQVTTEPRFFETLLRQHQWNRSWGQIVDVLRRAGSRKENLSRAFRLFWGGRRAIFPPAWADLVTESRRQSAWRKRTPPAWLGPLLRAMWPGPAPERHGSPHPTWNGRQRALWNQLTDPRQEWVMDLWDANAAHFGVEARFPFWDTTLVEFMLALPDAAASEFGQPRGVHKLALGAVLPREILERSDGAVFSSAQIENVALLIPAIRRVLRDGPWASHQYVDRAEAGKLLECVAAPSGVGALSSEGWRDWALLRDIAALELWMRAI